MKIHKKIAIKVNKESTYTLTKMGNFFLVNKSYRNYLTEEYFQRFVLLDENLKQIFITSSIEDASIYSVFPCQDGNRFLIYCDDPDILIYGDLRNNILFSLDISFINKDCLSPVFYWNKDSIILSTYSDIFYEFNIDQQRIIQLNLELMRKNHGDFYKFWLKTKQHSPIRQANFANKSFIYTNENNEIVFFDYKNNSEIKTQDPQNGYHDVIFHKGYFVFVSEDNLIITNDRETYEYPINNDYYIFLRACGVEKSKNFSIIVLESNKSCDTKNKLVRYQLS